jgi:hypothetical protein
VHLFIATLYTIVNYVVVLEGCAGRDCGAEFPKKNQNWCTLLSEALPGMLLWTAGISKV